MAIGKAEVIRRICYWNAQLPVGKLLELVKNCPLRDSVSDGRVTTTYCNHEDQRPNVGACPPWDNSDKEVSPTPGVEL